MSVRDYQGLAGMTNLVEGAVRWARPRMSGRQQRWVAVMDTFGTGSTTAVGLCRMFGLDPSEMLDGPMFEVDCSLCPDCEFYCQARRSPTPTES